MILGDILFPITTRLNIDPILVACIIQTESAGNCFAVRYEPAFYRRYIEDKKELLGHVPKSIPTLDTELRLRAFSFGLMQIMGQTAREVGFKGDNLTLLFKPEINIEVGCLVLLSKLKKHSFDKKKALLNYNGGADLEYPYRVLRNIENGKADKILKLELL